MARDVLEINGVTVEHKERLRAIAFQKLGRKSATFLIKDFIGKVLSENDVSTPCQKPSLQKQEENSKKERLEIRLLNGEMTSLNAIAESRLSSSPYYVTSLIRAHLSKTPQLQGDELEELRTSNYQLLSIGRNINQIARQLNSFYDKKITSSDIQYITDQINILNDTIKSHTKNITKVLDANLERWDISQ